MKEILVGHRRYRVHDSGAVEVECTNGYVVVRDDVHDLVYEILDLRRIRDRFSLRAFNAENAVFRFMMADGSAKNPTVEIPTMPHSSGDAAYARYLGCHVMLEAWRARWKVEGKTIEWI